MNRWIRDDLKNFSPYDENQIPYKYKMNANESPFPISKSIRKKIKDYIDNEDLKIYPNTNCDDLVKALASFYKLSEENISIGVGSDAIIDYAIKGLVGYNEKVLIPSPSFVMYKISTIMNRCIPVEYELDNEFKFSPEEIIQRVKTEDIKLLFICNPNSPTGTAYDRAVIKEIVEKVDIPVIIDEAYGEFAPHLSFIDDVKNYDNIIVLKTFSKAFGLAGLRIGYAVGNRELIDVINIIKPPYSVSTLSQFIALELLKNFQDIEKKVEIINGQREYLFNELSKLNFLKVYESHTNFIYVESSRPIHDMLYKEGFLLRKYNDIGNKEVLRITVGLKEENELLISILQGVL